MSTESMIRDVELAEEALPKKEGGPQGSRKCWCLSLLSFILILGATTVFCLLHFRVIGPQGEEVSVFTLCYFLTQREMEERGQMSWRKSCADGEETMQRDERDRKMGREKSKETRKDGEIKC